MTDLKRKDGERWTDKLGLGREPISLEDTVSKDFYELELEAVFRRSWLYVGRVERVSKPGDYFTKEFEALKQSVLVTRDRELGVRVFHNVCPHRGNKLMWETHADQEVSGRCNMFLCKFHGIGFDTSGSVSKLTDPKAWLGSQGEDMSLAPVPFEIWNGFIFVNFDRRGPQETLREFLGEHYWNEFDFPYEELTEHYTAVATAKANWKTMVDGFAEVYHATTTHALPFPSAAAMVGAGESFSGDYYNVRGRHREYLMGGYPDDFYHFEYERQTQAFGTGPRYPMDPKYRKLPLGPNPIEMEDWGNSSTMLFPNFFLQFYSPGWYVTYQMIPLAYNQMRFEIDMYMPPSRNFSELLSHKAGVQMFLEAALQDLSLLEAQHAGLEARAFEHYPLTDEEVCVRHFHEQIYAAVDQYKAETQSD